MAGSFSLFVSLPPAFRSNLFLCPKRSKKKDFHFNRVQLFSASLLITFNYTLKNAPTHSVTPLLWRGAGGEVSLSTILEPLSTILEPLSTILEPLSTILGPLSVILEPLSAILEPLSTILEPSLTIFKPSFSILNLQILNPNFQIRN